MTENKMFYSGSNPAFSANIAENVMDSSSDSVMTVSGSINKTAACLLLVVLSSLFSWGLTAQLGLAFVHGAVFTSVVATLVLAVFIVVKRMSPVIKYLVPAYALFEGLALGSISFYFEQLFPGIVSMALQATLGCIAVMLGLYKFNVIRVTEKLRSIIIMSTITVMGIYGIHILLSFFGMNVPIVNSTSEFGILFTGAIVVLASFNLLLDFEFVEFGAYRQFPKHMEWYAAFGLMVTIVWLYVELLKLLAKLQSRK